MTNTLAYHGCLHPSLILAGKATAYPEYVTGLQCKGRLLALPHIIYILGWKELTVTNTLAYFSCFHPSLILAVKAKSHMCGTPL